ncbi:MAG TPA: DUF1844 domain-containing protein [Sandaracinaceae bacterium LLY-WYZ-13_1]|nr:DUF1844 domain-containing protein [Sandaracinaceae bacterium LLY-WYZ-13_1]
MAGSTRGADGDGDGEGIPPTDFTTFVLSMSTACMAHLGEVEGPEGGALDLPMAKQSLEILEMLEEKTAGNLTGEEERILTQVLSDLRETYEGKSRG